MKTNLTDHQSDYAIFLPSISGFYATFIGKQRYGEYVDYSRIPNNLNSVESLNFLNPQQSAFNYKWALYSAGHADIDISRAAEKEDMIRNRDRSNSWLLGDSGGFQIAKGLWEGDWTDKNCPKASKKRKMVLEWMEEYMDYGMMLDIPTWTYLNPKSSKATNIQTYQDAVDATHINAEYYMNNRRGNFKVLNVLQGSNHASAENWYQEFKDYCDPAKYPDTHFNGWAMGGQNMCDVHLILKRIVDLIHDGLLEKDVHDVMHFLGTSRLEWAVLLTDIQRAVRKYHNSNFTITYDCASPFLATANGQIYHSIRLKDRGKWGYIMSPAADNKKFATDQRLFRDAVLQETILKEFEDSPITEDIKISDICYYRPGDLNKIGKEGSTSWDSFSYALQMAHNVWMHIESTQRANLNYDQGLMPKMLINDTHERLLFKELVEEIFSAPSKAKSMEIIEKHSRFWMQILGTKLNVGKKAINASAKFDDHFETVINHNHTGIDDKKEKTVYKPNLDNNLWG